MKGGTPYVSTTNACKLCKPLGACLAFKGIEGCIPYLHGSQGCATYMRRYIISHFREPVDIASSALGEKQAIYGGGPNLKKGILNLMQKYGATVVGVATTCLTETIGDDVPGLLREFKREFGDLDLPELVNVSTPSYSGTHMEGFHAAVRATVEQLVPEAGAADARTESVNILPGLVSPADIRHLKDIMEDFGLPFVLLPDYSDTLDGPALEDYQKIPEGGTPVAAIRSMGRAEATIEFGRTLTSTATAGKSLQARCGVPLASLGTPIGLRETDAFFAALSEISGRPVPRRHAAERGRLVDAYVDGHKYVAGKKALVYGEEDLAVGLTAFLAEIGVKPVMVASGGKSGQLAKAVEAVTAGILPEPPVVREGVDFHEIVEEAEPLAPDMVVGHSKGYRVASRAWSVPHVRVGFPIHDRFGGQRLQHLGYRGTQALFDRVVNAMIQKKQEDSPIGYGYI